MEKKKFQVFFTIFYRTNIMHMKNSVSGSLNILHVCIHVWRSRLRLSAPPIIWGVGILFSCRKHYITISLRGAGWAHDNCFNPPLFLLKCCAQHPEKWEVMYICAMGRFGSASLDFSIRIWYCSVSVVYFLFILFFHFLRVSRYWL